MDAIATLNRPRLGALLVQAGQLRQDELDRGLALQAGQPGTRIGSLLVRLGSISEDALYEALSRQLGLPLLGAEALEETAVRAGLAQLGRPLEWWTSQQALPLLDAAGQLLVMGLDPLSIELRESVESALPAGQALQWALLMPDALERWQALLAAGQQGLHELDARALRELAEDAPVIAFVNNVLAQAVEARASDIHLEPGEREFEVRFRIDGVLHTRNALPMARFAAITSRVKLVSQLDIAERRLPQDGRTSIRVAGAEMDIRVSSIPAVHGESIVMRLLPKQRGELALERLGMEPDQLRLFGSWLDMPNGLVLVTGPTGSGKSTTLYGALAAVNDFSRKIITVEDPVEFRLPHVVQIQTQAEIGYTFARALRSILRHDPDIIMIGEIRDRETAEIAVQSALTGHLVLATLHTNDALSAVTRLVDMGIEPYLVAAALKATMAQRLVRQLCPQCQAPAEPDAALLQRWAALQPRLGDAAMREAEARWQRPVGCAHCQQTGFRGRLGIYELASISEPMQHRIAAGAGLAELQAMADEGGRRSLLEDGLLKVRQGRSSFDEVLRASGASSLG